MVRVKRRRHSSRKASKLARARIMGKGSKKVLSKAVAKRVKTITKKKKTTKSKSTSRASKTARARKNARSRSSKRV